MVKCVFGGPEFVFKALHVCNLTSQFMIEQSNPLIEALRKIENAKLLAIVTVGHCMNQKFLSD